MRALFVTVFGLFSLSNANPGTGQDHIVKTILHNWRRVNPQLGEFESEFRAYNFRQAAATLALALLDCFTTGIRKI